MNPTTIDLETPLKQHIEEVALRCQQHEPVLVHQGIITLQQSMRGGAGRSAGAQCSIHAVLASTSEGEPLGLLGARAWAMPRQARAAKREGAEAELADQAGRLWVEGLQTAEARIPEGKSVVLIQAVDDGLFDLMTAARRPTTHLLTRVSHPRKVSVVVGAEAKQRALLGAAKESPKLTQLAVNTLRSGGRREHNANLSVHWGGVELIGPDRSDLPPERVSVNTVHAAEEKAAEGQRPLEWVLVTSMPIHTPEDAAQVVSYYALVWVMERYQYALKTGIEVERIDVGDVEDVASELPACMDVAYRLIHIEYWARVNPDAPATTVLSEAELAVLQQAAKESAPKNGKPEDQRS